MFVGVEWCFLLFLVCCLLLAVWSVLWLCVAGVCCALVIITCLLLLRVARCVLVVVLFVALCVVVLCVV